MKCPHTVSNDPTERLFKSGYGQEWSYTNVLIRFPHNSADDTRSTGLGYVSSYIRPVKMVQYPVGGFVNTLVFSHWRIMSQAQNCFPLFFLDHHSLTFGPGLFQNWMLSPHLYLDWFVFLVYEITRHIAIAMQQVIVDISQNNVSFDSIALLSLVPACNKVSSSSRGFSWLTLQHMPEQSLYFFNSFSS